MNSNVTCGNCKYWHRINGSNGECRRQPPQGSLQAGVNALTGKPQLGALAWFPPIDEQKWCGAHEMDFET